MSYVFICKYENCNGENFRKDPLVPPNGKWETMCDSCKNFVIFVSSQAQFDRAKSIDKDVTFVDCGTLDNRAPVEVVPERPQPQSLSQIVEARSAATLVRGGEYDQAVLIAKYSNAEKDIAKGVCQGQCLHWARRVLQRGGRVSYGAEGAKRPDKIDREKIRHLQGVDAQRISMNPAMSAFAREKFFGEIEKQVYKVSKGALSYQAELTEKHCNNKVRFSDKAYNDDELWEFGKLIVATVQKAVDELIDQFNRAGHLRAGWDTLAAELDRKLKDRKKKYSGIICTFSQNREPNHGALDGFLDVIVAELKAQSCILMSIGLEPVKTGVSEGHEIAVYRAAQDYTLFDPNAGVFQCTTSADFKNSVKALAAGWQELANWNLNNKFGYSVFIEKPAENKLANSTEVKFPNSLSATAYFNNLVLPE